MKIISYLPNCLFVAFIVTSLNAYSACNLLMKIPGIDGESTVSNYEKWICLENFSGSVSEGGCNSFSASKVMDTTSAAILSAATLGKVFADPIEVDTLTQGASWFASNKFFLNNAKITSVSLSTGSDRPGGESLTIAPEDITLNVYKQNESTGKTVNVDTANIVCGKIKTK